jgi:response regulator RpfG family c-di-GMP phosphodiesterase
MRSDTAAPSARVLVVDDEAPIREMLAEFLELEGYLVGSASDGEEALRELAKAPYDVVLTDLKMPRLGGIALLEALAESVPGVLAVIMTGFGTVETAIDAMKRGAYDYILKPFKLREVLHVIERAVEKKRIQAENMRLREALSLYQVSEAISASLSLDQVMDTVTASCLRELGADLVTAWLDDGEGGLVERHRRAREEVVGQADFGALSHQIVAARLRGDIPLLVHGEDAVCLFAGGSVEPTSFVAVPLRVQSRDIGFIAVASGSPGRKLEEGQRKLLSILASRAAAAIENARLYGDLQATFQQTIQGLAKAIDRMDPYTAGHSGRVARYAVYLARRMALDVDAVEIVRQTSLMHDIGKIGCALQLNKPGKLTDAEYDAFKLHPAHGRDILRPIKFLHPLIPGVHLHHERYDGHGYPLGLRGDDIPLVARIIAVADTYDAMTSDRSYRRALPHDVALAEVERCAGTQFEPDIARTFLDNIESFRSTERGGGGTVPE